MPPSAKRRKTENAIDEITFDISARQEFLTGFHKRKVQRAKHAQEKAEQRARQDRIEERKKLREERKADLERHVKTVNDMLRPAGLEVDSSSDDDGAEQVEWTGIEDDQPEPIDHEAEYIDEDKYTTVTVEAMDVTRDGLLKAEEGSDADEVEGRPATDSTEHKAAPSIKTKPSKRPWTKDRPPDEQKRLKKKRNFKYEGRTERKVNRAKQKLKNRKQAQARKGG